MDLSLHGNVLLRYWRIVAGGLVLALTLAVLSAARPAFDGPVPTVVYRTNELWQSQATLLITEPGFQEGRLFPQSNPGRFYQLADVYAQLATSDGVKKILKRQGPVDGTFTAAALRSSVEGASPLIAIAGKSTSPKKAQAVTQRATAAFLTYLNRRQRAAGIAPDARVTISVVRTVDPPLLLQPRKRTLPVMVLLAVLSATVAFVYVLERSRLRRQTAIRPVSVTPETRLTEDPQWDAPEEKREREPEPEEELVRSRRWA